MKNSCNSIDEAFWQKPPEKIIEWQDPESEAKGILVINELINGACGGGTRISPSTNVEELTHLAKMMQCKFATYGPHIGGAKSGLLLDPNHPKKLEILKRWFTFILPYLQSGYGTASDLNTNFTEINNLLRSLNIPHPQYGIMKALYQDGDKVQEAIERMQLLNAEITLENKQNVTVAQVVTGYLIAEIIEKAYRKKSESLIGATVVVQGVGTVGSAAAYYLSKMGAKIIGLQDKDGAVINKHGFSLQELCDVVKSLSLQKTFSDLLSSQKFYKQLKGEMISVFVPAAGSGLVDQQFANYLLEQHCELLVSGANIPFSTKDVESYLSKNITVIPSYISSGGMACAFSALLQDKTEVKTIDDLFSYLSDSVETLSW